MATTNAEEMRVRVTIDREMPDLFARLGNSKRQAREVVHLLRLGLQLEQMLSGKISWFGAAAPMGMPSSALAMPGVANSQPTQIVPTATADSLTKARPPSATEFAERTGLTADYFQSAPTTYNE